MDKLSKKKINKINFMPVKKNHKFAYLLSSLALLLILFPFLEQTNIGRHAFNIMLVLIIFTGIRAVSDTRKKLYASIALSGLAVGFQVARYFTTSIVVYYGSQIIMLIFFAFVTIVLFKHILDAKEVTHDEIFGAISVYILIALSFTSLFLMVNMVEPGSFSKISNVDNANASKGVSNNRMAYSDYMYYSFGTLTTAGSGEIVEIGSFVYSLSMFEAIMGVFYVAFIISKLVPNFTRRK